jgi:hypothetical protein
MADNIAVTQIFFPLRQADSASQADARSLLAREVFSSVQQIIGDRLEDAERQQVRAGHRHAAVLVDGERGTGKSSVLFNLSTYLNSVDKQLLDKVHVLKPIDPTLLENHDDLFLNIVIAAVLSDKAVKSAMSQNSDARTALYKRLQHLGHALENMQTQRDKKGLDKIRAFIGNQELVEEIHEFFDAALKLLGKKLLILPIDDVDASLHRAFENLEVVRRYLTSPFVLPVISGDANLYHDVTWRDFHGRLLKDSRARRFEAQQRAEELATEYHRKVLPLQYRLSMPTMREYFARDFIVLGDTTGAKLTFPHFHAWLEGLLNDRTNGLENSHLPVPIRTVRAFAQLVYRLQDLIPTLELAISAGNLTKEMLRHYMVLPDLPPSAIQTFKNTYQGSVVADDEKTRRNARDTAYSEFVRNYVTANGQVEPPLPLSGIPIAAWITSLRQHFSHDAEAGAAYLVLKAHEDWNKPKDSFGDKWTSVFDTPLFQPILQARGHAQFHTAHELNEWHIKLADLPESWLKQLPKATILPYPVPEIGPLVSSNMVKAYLATDVEPGQRLVAELLLHRNFYTSSKTGAVLCVGRIFEIVITSLLRDMTAADLGTILSRPPFYSFGALAQTKTLESEDLDDDELGETNTEPVELEPELAKFSDDINAWRKELKLENARLSPWLVYNVMNKFLNQAWLFNAPRQLVSDTYAFDRISWVARKAFNSIWAAFGSFEKGQIYGLPPVIATVNIGEGADFQNSDLYRQNITPFVGAKSGASQFGLRVGAITAMLESHPLKRLTDTLQPPPASESKTRVVITGTPRVKKQTVSEWLFEKTGKKQFNAAARQMQNWTANEVRRAVDEYASRFKNRRLVDAYERVRQPKGK